MSTAVQQPTRPGLAASLEDIFNFQRRCVADARNYEFLGRMKKIVLEAEAGTPTQGPAVTSKIGHVLEWYNTPRPQGGVVSNYLPIGQTWDRKMVLALEFVLKRDNAGRLTPEVGLPDMPDPSWRPSDIPNTEEAERMAASGQLGIGPPMIAQDLNRLTDKIIRGSEYLVFQPVSQVLFQLAIGGELRAEYSTLLFSYDPVTGTHPTFCVDRRTGEAHFYGGRYTLERV
jgi:hypothetical protein